jgi:hypothetical protein
VEPHAFVARQLRRSLHQLRGHRKRRARRQRDPHHRTGSRIVVLADEAPTVRENRALVLDHVVRRETALALAAAHRAARGLEPDAHLARGRDLDVDQALLPARE